MCELSLLTFMEKTNLLPGLLPIGFVQLPPEHDPLKTFWEKFEDDYNNLSPDDFANSLSETGGRKVTIQILSTIPLNIVNDTINRDPMKYFSILLLLDIIPIKEEYRWLWETYSKHIVSNLNEVAGLLFRYHMKKSTEKSPEQSFKKLYQDFFMKCVWDATKDQTLFFLGNAPSLGLSVKFFHRRIFHEIMSVSEAVLNFKRLGFYDKDPKSPSVASKLSLLDTYHMKRKSTAVKLRIILGSLIHPHLSKEILNLCPTSGFNYSKTFRCFTYPRNT